MEITTKEFFNSSPVKVTIALFIILTIWRVLLLILPYPEGEFNPWSFYWGASYQIVAIWGALWGLKNSVSWGGYNSVLGRAIITFSLGLLFQAIGQTIYSIYIYNTGDVMYPSLGDIGFFGSIPFYIYGAFLLGKLARVSISMKSLNQKALALIIPLSMVAASYIIFLNNHDYSSISFITTFLDFGYPLGQAIYVGIAILVLLLIFSKNHLGGIMRGCILLFLAALVIQYISDFTFLYQTSRELYIPEGINDFMYLSSYLLMALSLIRLGVAFNILKKS